jgi:hypothetical protein
VTGSQAGNALKLRGELAFDLASLEDEQDRPVVMQSFVDKMEGMIVGAAGALRLWQPDPR